MEQRPPHPVGTQPREISLTRKLIPWELDDSKPVFLTMPASPAYYLACFSTKESLEALMVSLAILDYKIKEVQDGRDFLDSLPDDFNGSPVLVILDPYVTERGTVRFQQVLRPEREIKLLS